MILIGDTAFAWKVKKQDRISDSTVVAEYKGLSLTNKELKWLRMLLMSADLTDYVDVLRTVLSDNQGAIRLSENHVVSDRSKHVDVQYHAVGESVKLGEVKFKQNR